MALPNRAEAGHPGYGPPVNQPCSPRNAVAGSLLPRRARRHVGLCALVITALFASTATPVPVRVVEAAPITRSLSAVSATADEFEAVAATLPADAVAATMILVELATADDGRLSRAAIGELLRRAGFALVTTEGAAVAVPDGMVLYNIPIYVDLLTELSDAVRNGSHYSTEELGWMLADMGSPGAEPIASSTIVAALGDWGKGEGAPVESVVAGTAVRALAARRGEVLWYGGDAAAVVIDPLQLLLLVGHLTSDVLVPQDADTASTTTTILSGGLMHRDRSAKTAVGVCQDLRAVMEATKPGRTYVKIPVSNQLGEELLEKFHKWALGEESAKALKEFGEIKDKAEKAASVLTLLLLLLGAKLTLTHDGGGTGDWQTHFRHEADDDSKTLTVTATARFDSSLVGKRLDCWALAGIELPKESMEGFTVMWSLEQPSSRLQDGGAYLTPISADSKKFATGSGGEVLTATGSSTVHLLPRKEATPPQPAQRELEGWVRVNARLDHSENPLDPTNMFKIADGSFELAVSILKRAGLPSTPHDIKVRYHGADIFVATGASDVFLGFVTLPVFLDIYSCAGPEGPWMGRGGFGSWSKTALASAAEYITGQAVPAGFSMVNENMLFFASADAEDGTPFKITDPDPLISGVMELDLIWLNRPAGARAYNGSISRPAGTVEVLLSQKSFPYGSLTYPVLWVQQDDRCPPADATF